MLHALLLAAALSPVQVDAVIAGAEKAFGDYVFPAVAKSAVVALKQREHAYRAIADPAALVTAVNADLLAVTHDKHVRLNYPFDPAMIGSSEPDAAQQHRYDAFMNYFFTTVRRLPGNVGYVDFRGFSSDADAGRAINAAMAFVAQTDALIIDLRANHGGDPRAAQALEGYFFSDPQQITSIILRDPQSGKTSEVQQYTSPSVPGSLYLDKPVYLLTSGHTFSCAEQFTYDLHNLKRVTIVGETTGGGANPGGFEPIGNQFAIFIPTGRAYSPVTHTNWEGTGIAPDVASPAAGALLRAYGVALDAIAGKAKDPDLAAAVAAARKDPAAALQQ
jgi:hypothetical protein